MYDLHDERGVPVSAGIPPLVRIAAAIGLLIIFVMGALVISASAYGHSWPAENTLKIPL